MKVSKREFSRHPFKYILLSDKIEITVRQKTVMTLICQTKEPKKSVIVSDKPIVSDKKEEKVFKRTVNETYGCGWWL